MYNQIYKSLEILSKNKGVNLYPHEQGYMTRALKDRGFTEILLSKFKVHEKYRHDYMQLTIQLNPTKLLGRDIIELTKEEDLKDVEQKFNEIIEVIHIDLNTFMYWTLNRIDYAINIKTQYVKEYIQLFQRSNIPYRFKMPYDKTSKVRKQKKGSFYLFSNSTIINFYDKSDERKKNTGEEVETAKDILRLEVQCLKGKTDALKRKYDFRIKYLGYFLSKDISDYVIKYYYDKTIGKGNYYKLKNAVKIVNESDHRKDIKEKLINVLDEVSLKRSIYKAKKSTNYTKESFNNYIKLLRNLGINPVTIPKLWTINYLENLESKIDLEFKDKL